MSVEFTTYIVAHRFTVALFANCGTNQPSIVRHFSFGAFHWLGILAFCVWNNISWKESLKCHLLRVHLECVYCVLIGLQAFCNAQATYSKLVTHLLQSRELHIPPVKIWGHQHGEHVLCSADFTLKCWKTWQMWYIWYSDYFTVV